MTNCQHIMPYFFRGEEIWSGAHLLGCVESGQLELGLPGPRHGRWLQRQEQERFLLHQSWQLWGKTVVLMGCEHYLCIMVNWLSIHHNGFIFDHIWYYLFCWYKKSDVIVKWLFNFFFMSTFVSTCLWPGAHYVQTRLGTTHTHSSQSVAVSPMAVWHPVNCAGPITELLS